MNEKRHSSYGMVGFHRYTCGGEGQSLVGSSIRHTEGVMLTIRRASLKRDLSRDWWFGGESLIEVSLSPVQFASLLTTMNVGDGVPCTIRHVGSEKQDDPPAPDNTHAMAKHEFRDTCAGVASRLDSAIAAVDALKVSKKAKEELRDHLTMARQDIASNLPFIEKSFTETTEHTVAEAKAEVDAMVIGAVQRYGLEELRLRQLTDGKGAA